MPYEKYFEEVKKALNGFIFYSLDLSKIPNQQDPGYGIFRAREVVDHPFSSTNDLWARPKEAIREMGRCHNIGESMLYCSNFFATCLVECRAKKNTRWVVTEYEIIKGKKIIIVPLGLNGERFIRGETNPNMIPSILNTLNANDRKKFIRISDYLKKTFKEKIGTDFWKYKRTVAIVHYLTKSDDFKDQSIAIMYPSVTSQFYGINFAFNSIEAREKLRIKRVYYVEVKDIDLNKRFLKFSFLADGEVVNENIRWITGNINHFSLTSEK